MTARHVLKAVVERRPQKAWWAYLPLAAILCWLALWGWGEGGVVAAWPYLLLLLVCGVQCVYSTLLGWVLLFVPCVVYALAVAVTPHNGTVSDYVVFFLCGAVPAAFLLLVRPTKKHRGEA
jgi:hypothetical protein